MRNGHHIHGTAVLFREHQRFGRAWTWLLIPSLLLLVVLSILLAAGRPAASAWILVWVGGPTLLVALLFLTMRLDLHVRADGIHVRYFPFHLTYRHFNWERLASLQVRRYSPIAEYGGWGIRLGWFGKGKAYNVSGDQGLQLEFTNGERLLIGTQRPQELAEALTRIEHVRT